MAPRIFALLLALIAVPAAGAELREPRILTPSPQPESANAISAAAECEIPSAFFRFTNVPPALPSGHP